MKNTPYNDERYRAGINELNGLLTDDELQELASNAALAFPYMIVHMGPDDREANVEGMEHALAEELIATRLLSQRFHADLREATDKINAELMLPDTAVENRDETYWKLYDERIKEIISSFSEDPGQVVRACCQHMLDLSKAAAGYGRDDRYTRETLRNAMVNPHIAGTVLMRLFGLSIDHVEAYLLEDLDTLIEEYRSTD